jgi:hypothetical protein
LPPLAESDPYLPHGLGQKLLFVEIIPQLVIFDENPRGKGLTAEFFGFIIRL